MMGHNINFYGELWLIIVSPAKQKRDICIAFPVSSLSSSLAAAAA